MYKADTITAIATALGESAIGIVRISGDEAIEIANSVFKGRNLKQVASHTINYGHIHQFASEQIIDEVMVSVMHAPRTYTREDCVEINCHGGIVATQSVLDAVLAAGARMAEPGEFTKRAFLNGRLDLSQAEAVMDLIEAKTQRAMDASMDQLKGSLSNKIRNLRQRMLDTLAQVEVTIDYPEYDDVEELSGGELYQTALASKAEVKQILSQAQRGTIFREGLKTAIIGRPNVGKSSLLNLLAGSDKAIVTDIAGTTRDTIEEYINIKGVPLHIIDTAGIRQTDEIVEQIGVQKSRELIHKADLIILIINGAEALDPVDIELLRLTEKQERIILLNKYDLAAQITKADLLAYADEDEIIATSMISEAGIDLLEAQIEKKFFSGQMDASEQNYLLNSRHTALLQKTIQALDEVLNASQDELPVDLIQIDFTHAWDLLGEITGDSIQDELLDKLFSQFCLGK